MLAHLKMLESRPEDVLVKPVKVKFAKLVKLEILVKLYFYRSSQGYLTCPMATLEALDKNCGSLFNLLTWLFYWPSQKKFSDVNI